MKLIAKTLYGLEPVLAKELIAIGSKDVREVNRAVTFTGDLKLLCKANYCLRTALSILVAVSEFRIRSSKDLYNNCLKIDWDKYLDSNSTFSVVPVVKSDLFTHTGYAGLLIKDAVADWFRSRTGKRPSVNSTDPDILINLHLSHDKATISLDSSVVPLYKRGYRVEQSVAPLNEVLAAGMIMLSGWDGRTPLIDPMCGSGTIPIEAGLMACRVPPGKSRSFFGFQRWKDYDDNLFTAMKEEIDSEIAMSPVKIAGSDISGDAVAQAGKNVHKAGLDEVVKIEIADFKDLLPDNGEGLIFINPPYGRRIQPAAITELYSMIGAKLKHSYAGKSAFIITSDKEYLMHVGLRPREKKILYNGALECIFAKYELYQGTKKRGHKSI
ncbi:MAG: class I SAM-dependent RNA methyltransferase [Bacteroidales bacterium]|nr:class I SAM-dependent RNA methyltransferase [Bacteroidales bacterium]